MFALGGGGYKQKREVGSTFSAERRCKIDLRPPFCLPFLDRKNYHQARKTNQIGAWTETGRSHILRAKICARIAVRSSPNELVRVRANLRTETTRTEDASLFRCFEAPITRQRDQTPSPPHQHDKHHHHHLPSQSRRVVPMRKLQTQRRYSRRSRCLRGRWGSGQTRS